MNLWRWAEGDQPLWGEDEPDVPWEPEGREAVEAFQRRARPPELRSVERHPAGRALEDVRYAVESVLTAAAVRGTPLPEDGLLRVRRGAAAEAPKQLRQSLQRLLREVEHLIDDLPDEHPDVLKAVEDGRDELRQIFNGRGNG